MLSENSIIQMLKQQFPTHIGDDAAVIPCSDTACVVISKDLLNENTHFRVTYHPPELLAHKALHVNLSDIAAMGASPKYVLLGLGLPKAYEPNIETFLNAFSKACKNSGVTLIGGDTTRAEVLTISITAIGESPLQNIKYRSTAKAGDILCITGQLGFAHLGFQALEAELSDFERYKQAFLKPTARIKEGIWLGQQPDVHAMMDISDGLAIDLSRLSKSSNTACIINLESFQNNLSFQSDCATLKLDPLEVQLAGGEDYELLCSVSPEAFPALKKAFNAQFDCGLHAIGTLTDGQGTSYIQNGKIVDYHVKPFLHFGELPF